jgi:hypothetical protein
MRESRRKRGRENGGWVKKKDKDGLGFHLLPHCSYSTVF